MRIADWKLSFSLWPASRKKRKTSMKLPPERDAAETAQVHRRRDQLGERRETFLRAGGAR
jgi:hypothetical protein